MKENDRFPQVEVLIKEMQIKKRVEEIADQIIEDYKGKEFILVGVLKGANFFLADLARELGRRGLSPRLGFIGKSSYGEGIVSSGAPSSTHTLDIDIKGKDVVLVEDIIDTGHTLNDLLIELVDYKSLETCVLLDKEGRREVEVPIKYRGFVVPNKFLVGYGLDAREEYRCLPFVGVLPQIATGT